MDNIILSEEMISLFGCFQFAVNEITPKIYQY